jgi:hypothetical protein
LGCAERWRLFGPFDLRFDIDRVAHTDPARHDYTRIHTPQLQGSPNRRVHKLKGPEAETTGEFLAARVGRHGDLDDDLPHPQPCTGGSVRFAQIEVDVQLIASQGGAHIIAANEMGKARVDQRELPLGIRANRTTRARPP